MTMFKMTCLLLLPHLFLLAGNRTAMAQAPFTNITFGYAGLNYAKSSIFKDKTGTQTGIQSGFYLKTAHLRKTSRTNTYLGPALLVLSDLSPRGVISTFALELDVEHFFDDHVMSGWFVNMATGVAVNFAESATDYSNTTVDQNDILVSGGGTFGINLTLGTGYNLRMGDRTHFGIGPGISFLLISGQIVPAILLSGSLFF